MFSPVVSTRSLTIDVPEGKDVTFISDVHLGFGDREADRKREAVLNQVLSSVRNTTCHLFFVGDLFDFWFDYKTTIPKGHVRTLAMLHEFIDGGIPITYLMGNHDFGHWKYFEEEIGIKVEKGDIDALIAGKRFYISHGDGKAANDKGYLFLRSILRSSVAQAMFRFLHPDIGIRLASHTSQGSRGYTAGKDYGTTDGLRDFAISKLSEGYDVVVMGHRHQSAYERINHGLYVNLGDWLNTTPMLGRFTIRDGMQLIFAPH